MNEKKYIHGIKIKIREGKFGEFLSISICSAMFKEHENEKGWINITGYKSKKPTDQYGDYYFVLNEYKKDIIQENQAKNDFMKNQEQQEIPFG